MSTSPEAPTKTLTQMVATRIRIAMAVEDIKQSELSRRMGKNEQWLSVRLRGRQPIDVNDLMLFARALKVGIHQLLPDPEEAAQAADAQATASYLGQPVQRSDHAAVLTGRPRDNRPSGHPGGSGPNRTARISRERGPK